MELIRFPKDYMHLHEIPSKDTTEKRNLPFIHLCLEARHDSVFIGEIKKQKLETLSYGSHDYLWFENPEIMKHSDCINCNSFMKVKVMPPELHKVLL